MIKYSFCNFFMWCIYSYTSGLLHWYRNSQTITRIASDATWGTWVKLTVHVNWRKKSYHYLQAQYIRHKSPNLNVYRIDLPNLLKQVLSRDWRCSWSSADRWCSNYIWVINNFIAYKVTLYIRDWRYTRLFAIDENSNALPFKRNITILSNWSWNAIYVAINKNSMLV